MIIGEHDDEIPVYKCKINFQPTCGFIEHSLIDYER